MLSPAPPPPRTPSCSAGSTDPPTPSSFSPRHGREASQQGFPSLRVQRWRTSAATNTDPVARHDEELVEVVSVVGEDVVQAFDLHRQLSEGSEAEEDHARVRFAVHEDQLAEVAVVGNEYSNL